MQTVTLNNGVEMPILGFGVFQVPDADTERAVAQALEVGYRSIDTAAAYTNERAVGRAIAASGIPRDELFVTTKLWVSDTGDQRTRAAFERSLERLGLDTLDLYLIHQPFGDYYGAWRAMEQLNADGHVRGARCPNRVLGTLRRGPQQPVHPPGLTLIAHAHDKTVPQVVLRWLIQRRVVAIPKSVRRDRMAENFNVFDFTLTDDEMADIAGLDTGASLFLDHRDPAVAARLGTYRLGD